MAKAQLCPVCVGRRWLVAVPFTGTIHEGRMDVCHGCEGKGWIVVPEDQPEEVYSKISETTTYLPEANSFV